MLYYTAVHVHHVRHVYRADRRPAGRIYMQRIHNTIKQADDRAQA